jgi:hypothetical protein
MGYDACPHKSHSHHSIGGILLMVLDQQLGLPPRFLQFKTPTGGMKIDRHTAAQFSHHPQRFLQNPLTLAMV